MLLWANWFKPPPFQGGDCGFEPRREYKMGQTPMAGTLTCNE